MEANAITGPIGWERMSTSKNVDTKVTSHLKFLRKCHNYNHTGIIRIYQIMSNTKPSENTLSPPKEVTIWKQSYR